MKMNSRFAKVTVASGLVVATGAAVLGLTGFASAEMARQSSAVVTVADTAAGEGTTDASNLGTLQAEGSVRADSAESTTGVVKSRPQVLAAAANTLGVTEAELVAELKSGKSIKNVADAKNIDIATVTDAMVAAVKTHLDAEVAAGQHTQEEADKKLAEFTTRVSDMVNRTGVPHGKGGKGGHGGKHGMGRAPFATSNLAETLKLSASELQTELRAGKSIKQIADAQNINIDDVKNVLTADFKAHLDEEVASGHHTQAEADEKLAGFTARLDDMVNRVRPAGGPEGRGGHGGHGGGHGRGDRH